MFVSSELVHDVDVAVGLHGVVVVVVGICGDAFLFVVRVVTTNVVVVVAIAVMVAVAIVGDAVGGEVVTVRVVVYVLCGGW